MSENAVCFFSGTGNSFDIAKRLCGKLPEAQLYNMVTMASYENIKDCKRVGLVFPVYGFTVPNIVGRFIEGLPFKKDTYYFCVPTMGAFALGAFYRTAEAFAAAGGHLDYIDKVYMPENYILFSNVPPDKLIAKHLANSNKRVDEISRDVLANRMKPATKPFTYGFVEKTSKAETEKWKDTAKGFQVSGECTRCGKCVRLCPVKNISLDGGSVVFANRCECCLSCVHACPKQAINYGQTTVGKKRYINPNINIEDMKKY